jgi:alpha-tubulin suppressor-like RCC1 family protein
MAGAARNVVAAVLVVVVAVLADPVGTEAQAPPAEGDGVVWRSVSAGTHHTCAVTSTDDIYCWGYDVYGALGIGGGANIRSTPMPILDGGDGTWVAVSAGGWADNSHTCGLRSAGQLFCWGADGNGQLGDGEPLEDQFTPSEVAGHSFRWAAVSAGDGHTCAIKTNRRLFCWGLNHSGQVGDGSTVDNRPTPVEVAGRTADWASVSAGHQHTCARKVSGRLFCWGSNGHGQMGVTRDIPGTRRPREVAGGRTDWAEVSAGHRHTCARTTGRRLFCWGDNIAGQLGSGQPNATGVDAPREVAGGGTKWVSVSVSGYHSCARKDTGRLWCWGRDGFGQLGDDTTFGDRSRPVQVAGDRTDWRRVDVGFFHSCAPRRSGALSCWGHGGLGVLGVGGTGDDEPVPVDVAAP